MTVVNSTARPSRTRLPVAAGAAALLLLVVWGIVSPRAVVHGWLIAFASVGAVPLGAFAWLAIHRLTGGKWGELARPVLTGAVSLLPLLVLFWLPLWIAARLIYPWAGDPSAAGDAGVAALYLNGGAFALRGLVGLVGLCVLAWLGARHPHGSLSAGLALVFYTVFMNFAPFGWLLSLDPHFNSSAFGVQIIVQQLISALALAAVVVRPPPELQPAWKDVGALLMATTLGETYLIVMTFIVFWYGDLPDNAAWYLQRTQHGWLWLEVAGIVIGSIGPLIALLFARVRDNSAALRAVGICLMVGVFLENVWLIAPAAESWSVATGFVASVAMVGLCWGLLGPVERFMEVLAHGG